MTKLLIIIFKITIKCPWLMLTEQKYEICHSILCSRQIFRKQRGRKEKQFLQIYMNTNYAQSGQND